MEKHKCKLCFKNFSNGRALGGHMRSHMLNLPIPQKQGGQEGEPGNQLSDDTESASSPASSSCPSEDEEGEEKGLLYGLRENPKRSIRLVDPEFSFAVDAGSVVLQDRESETESSKNPTRRRSKRTRILETQYQHRHHHHHQQQQRQEPETIKKLKFNKLGKTESWAEPEPVSSISDTTTEEDVAFCLMMLSRDTWKRKEKQHELLFHEEEHQEHEEAEKSMEETDESEEFKIFKNRSRGKYKCETCKKVFKSYQALGGHRASHKKIKFYTPTQEPESGQENAGTSGTVPMLEKKVHECPVCFRVFSSGQALGGHKRTHVTGSVAVAASTSARSSTKVGENLIDLNLPAPFDDDDISQIELSAVSDAEFVNHIKR